MSKPYWSLRLGIVAVILVIVLFGVAAWLAPLASGEIPSTPRVRSLAIAYSLLSCFFIMAAFFLPVLGGFIDDKKGCS
ncbi:hypothetical protein [Oceanicaulis sp.]|uniref:hypothetical protein n=1 Tax=Oceanicaulis sp. TaxID=1924941 RepID=UPI003D2CCBDB